MRIRFGLAVGMLALTTLATAEGVGGKLELTPVEDLPGTQGNRILVYKHKAAPEMDSPGYVAAGYEYHVTFGIPEGYRPEEKNPLPVILFLHGFGDTWQNIKTSPNWFPKVFTLVPNDPLGTWFYGYSDQLPGGDPNKGMVVNYTERRLLAYLDHFEALYPIDRNRVYVMGGSMGGTGTTSLALRYPNIFAAADAKKGATNRLYCKWKSQCEGIWGRVDSKVKNNDGVNVWDWQNMAWYAEHHHAAATWIRTMHGREDTSIPYRQIAGPPGVSPMSFYSAMETFKIGHECLWDGSSHSRPAPKPVALDDWWEPFNDATCFFRLDLSFPAFSHFSANDHPGTGAGDAVGDDSQLGDNTYDGDPSGGLNRFLRWNSTTISDEKSRYSIEIRLTSGPNGYKGKGEVVDVTPRRLQRFAVKPGGAYSWSTSAGQNGQSIADAEGLLTIPAVKIGTAWTTLTVQESRQR